MSEQLTLTTETARVNRQYARFAAGSHSYFLLETLVLGNAGRARAIWVLVISGDQFLVGSVFTGRFASVYAILRTLVRQHL
jgi:hypothetical protein